MIRFRHGKMVARGWCAKNPSHAGKMEALAASPENHAYRISTFFDYKKGRWSPGVGKPKTQVIAMT